MTGAPFGRDLIAELAEACAKHHMKLGLYYSQELDWHEPDGGGYGARERQRAVLSAMIAKAQKSDLKTLNALIITAAVTDSCKCRCLHAV